MKLYDLKEDYFDIINTNNKAYWLGLLLSDGTIYKNNSSYTLGLTLLNEDSYLLSLLLNEINSDSKINIINNKYSNIKICNKRICESLISHGVVENKSMIVKLPNVDETLLPHLIRGIFDGDGTISISKNKNANTYRSRVKIVSGSPYLINSLHDVFTLWGVSSYKYFDKRGKGCHEVYITKKEDVKNFYKIIYENANIFMHRKKNKFINV